MDLPLDLSQIFLSKGQRFLLLMIDECPSGRGRIKDEIPAVVAAEAFHPRPLIVDVECLRRCLGVELELVGQGDFGRRGERQKSGCEGHL